MTYLLAQASAHRIPLRDETVQCVVTSPPYWGLRGYEGRRPVRIDCPVEGCTRRVWRDGVNPGELQHVWARHG